jgi:CDP-diacylglycerol--glycerol-3-phosphate 3-phosphatidyltransferase
VSYDTYVREYVGADRLTTELLLTGVVALAWLFGVHRWLADVRSIAVANRWLVPTATVATFVVGFLWYHRAANRTATGERLATLGVANAVTLARGGLFAGVAGFVLLDPSSGSVLLWLPALWYGTGVALDAADGFLARTVGTPTRLGERLDMAMDTTGFLVAPVVAVAWGRLPVWYLSLSAARYLFKFGVAARRRRGLPVRELPESALRRPLAGLQMVFITIALVPLVPATLLVPAAAAVLLPSLTLFVQDYLVVSDRICTKPRNDPPAKHRDT